MVKVIKANLCLIALALMALAICPGCDPVYVYARPDIRGLEEIDGEIKVRWESMNPVTTITRYNWNDRKGGWDIEFEDRVTNPYYYHDAENLIPGNIYGYVVYDDIEYSGMRSITYKGSDTTKD